MSAPFQLDAIGVAKYTVCDAFLRRQTWQVNPATALAFHLTQGQFKTMPSIELVVSSTVSSCNMCSQTGMPLQSDCVAAAAAGWPFDELKLCNACRCLELTDNDPRYTIFAFGTGYLNVLGQAANLGCSAYLTADCIDFMVGEVNGHQFSPLEKLLTYASELLQSLV